MRFLTKLGLAITAVWLVLFGLIVSLKFSAAIQMDLNEWGDFLAGLSAPLALLWLVIGYFQQGEELRLNTEALKAQQEELRRQVEETSFLVKNAERQAAAAESLASATISVAERETKLLLSQAQPKIVPAGGSSSTKTITTNVKNIGGDIHEVEFHYDGQYQVRLSVPPIWKTDTDGTLTVEAGKAELQFPIGFEISYADKFDSRQKRSFEMVDHHKIVETDQLVTYE